MFLIVSVTHMVWCYFPYNFPCSTVNPAFLPCGWTVGCGSGRRSLRIEMGRPPWWGAAVQRLREADGALGAEGKLGGKYGDFIGLHREKPWENRVVDVVAMAINVITGEFDLGFGVVSVLITDILTVGTTDFGNNMDVWKGEEKGELWGSGWYSSYIEPGKAQKFDDVWWSFVGFQWFFFGLFNHEVAPKKNMAIFRGDIPGQWHRSDIQDAGGSPAENNSRFGWSFTLPLFVQYHCSIKHIIMLTIIKH